jgi:hypothetical protein
MGASFVGNSSTIYFKGSILKMNTWNFKILISVPENMNLLWTEQLDLQEISNSYKTPRPKDAPVFFKLNTRYYQVLVESQSLLKM